MEVTSWYLNTWQVGSGTSRNQSQLWPHIKLKASLCYNRLSQNKQTNKPEQNEELKQQLETSGTCGHLPNFIVEYSCGDAGKRLSA